MGLLHLETSVWTTNDESGESSPHLEDNGDSAVANIALSLELITFDRFGTPRGSVFPPDLRVFRRRGGFWVGGALGHAGDRAQAGGGARRIHADFHASRQSNSCMALPQF